MVVAGWVPAMHQSARDGTGRDGHWKHQPSQLISAHQFKFRSVRHSARKH